MERFLVKHFDPGSRYVHVEAATPKAAAEKFTGQRLRPQPPGEVLALVQVVVRNVVTTVPFYGDAREARPAAGQALVLPEAPPTVVLKWCDEERGRLQAEIDEIESGRVRVERITKSGPADISQEYLAARRAGVARLEDAIKSFGSPSE